MKFKEIRYFLIYWLLFFAILVVLTSIYDGDFLGGIYLNLARIPIIFIISIIVIHGVVNQTNWKLLFKGVAIFFLLLTGVLTSRWLFGLLVFPYHFSEEYTFTFFDWYKILSQFIIFIAGLGGYGLLIYYYEKESWRKKQTELIKEKRNSELRFLKAQIQPHFLHNTLNGIYNETIKKSEKAGDMIIKLSELMRFMFQEGKNYYITVSKELALIDNYVQLESLRFGDRVKVESQIDEMALEAKVPPLLFFGLIENAFKHGVNLQLGDTFVKYNFHSDEKYMYFEVSNSSRDVRKSDTDDEGIGLINLKRQLELIYNEDFELEQYMANDVFFSKLKIPYHV